MSADLETERRRLDELALRRVGVFVDKTELPPELMQFMEDIIAKKVEEAIAEIKKSVLAENQEIQLQEKICSWLDKSVGLKSKYAGQYVAITYDGEILASASEELELLNNLHKPEYANKRFFIYAVPPAPIGRI